MAKVIAVDFDGTLCTNKYPEIGEPILPTILYVKRAREQGDTIILWTCRADAELKAALDWCARQGLVFDYVNSNTTENIALYGSDSRKIFADVYIDDKAADIDALLHQTKLYAGGRIVATLKR